MSNLDEAALLHGWDLSRTDGAVPKGVLGREERERAAQARQLRTDVRRRFDWYPNGVTPELLVRSMEGRLTADVALRILTELARDGVAHEREGRWFAGQATAQRGERTKIPDEAEMMTVLRALPPGWLSDDALKAALGVHAVHFERICSFGMSARLLWPHGDGWRASAAGANIGREPGPAGAAAVPTDAPPTQAQGAPPASVAGGHGGQQQLPTSLPATALPTRGSGPAWQDAETVGVAALADPPEGPGEGAPSMEELRAAQRALAEIAQTLREVTGLELPNPSAKQVAAEIRSVARAERDLRTELSVLRARQGELAAIDEALGLTGEGRTRWEGQRVAKIREREVVARERLSAALDERDRAQAQLDASRARVEQLEREAARTVLAPSPTLLAFMPDQPSPRLSSREEQVARMLFERLRDEFGVGQDGASWHAVLDVLEVLVLPRPAAGEAA
ncbi:MAG TPA: hypothetical protein VEB22_15250 [Phycisphaerales bacterium]|nr:hypothetical protein [Phycisphaerales bacterium]